MPVLCLYGCAGGGWSCLESIGREHCRACGGPENRRTLVLYYDLSERDDYRDCDRRHGTLLSEEPARRDVHGRDEDDGL